MEKNRERIRKTRSSQDIVNETNLKGRGSRQQQEIFLPRIGDQQHERKEQKGIQSVNNENIKWTENSFDKPRKRSGSNLEDPYKNGHLNKDNTLSIPSNNSPCFHKTSLKEYQNEEKKNESALVQPHDCRHIDYISVNVKRSLSNDKKEKYRTSNSPDGTKRENEKDEISPESKYSHSETPPNISRRDTDHTIKTYPALSSKQGRDLENIFGQNPATATALPRPLRKISLNGIELESYPNQTSKCIYERSGTPDKVNNNIIIDGRRKFGHIRKKEHLVKINKARDLDDDLVQKVRVHESLVREKRILIGKSSRTGSNLQRLERPCSSLRDHIRKEDARYSLHQTETKRILFEKWLQSTNEYLFPINKESK